jgi:hypothetical protein
MRRGEPDYRHRRLRAVVRGELICTARSPRQRGPGHWRPADFSPELGRNPFAGFGERLPVHHLQDLHTDFGVDFVEVSLCKTYVRQDQ